MKKSILIAVVTSLLVLLAACGSGIRSELHWPTSELASKLPKPTCRYGEVEFETKSDLEIILYGVSKDGFADYIDTCKDLGFTVDYMQDKENYSAKNEDGDSLYLTYNEKKRTLEIWLSSMSSSENEENIASGTNTVRTSGFDETTNQTIAFKGVEFSFPAYFDVLDEGSTEDLMHYYPEPENYYCSLIFVAGRFDLSQEEFDSEKAGLVESLFGKDEDVAYTTLDSKEKSVAGLSGWTISYQMDDEVSSTVYRTIFYHPENKLIISVLLTYDETDEAPYDYAADYEKILASATLSSVAKQSLVYKGIEFTYPSDYKIEVSDNNSYDYLLGSASEDPLSFNLIFFASYDANMTTAQFEEKKYELAEHWISSLEKTALSDKTTEEISLAGLPGISITGHTTLDSLPCEVDAVVAFDAPNKSTIMVLLLAGDESATFQNVSDFREMIDTAVLESSDGDKKVINNSWTGIRPEFKELMDSYEAFFDEYGEFMTKYENSDDTSSMVWDYLSYLSKYIEMVEALEKVGDEEMSTEEALYYSEVMLRISQKLLTSS